MGSACAATALRIGVTALALSKLLSLPHDRIKSACEGLYTAAMRSAKEEDAAAAAAAAPLLAALPHWRLESAPSQQAGGQAEDGSVIAIDCDGDEGDDAGGQLVGSFLSKQCPLWAAAQLPVQLALARSISTLLQCCRHRSSAAALAELVCSTCSSGSGSGQGAAGGAAAGAALHAWEGPCLEACPSLTQLQGLLLPLLQQHTAELVGDGAGAQVLAAAVGALGQLLGAAPDDSMRGAGPVVLKALSLLRSPHPAVREAVVQLVPLCLREAVLLATFGSGSGGGEGDAAAGAGAGALAAAQRELLRLLCSWMALGDGMLPLTAAAGGATGAADGASCGGGSGSSAQVAQELSGGAKPAHAAASKVALLRAAAALYPGLRGSEAEVLPLVLLVAELTSEDHQVGPCLRACGSLVTAH